MMRTDQFIAQCIIKCLKNEHIRVKSPEASRTYTFTEDVMEFYRLFLEKFEQDDQQFDGFVIYNGGNQEDKPYTTMNVAEIIQNLTGAQNNLSPDEYEVGELVNNQPVYQWEKSLLAEKLLGWKPKYALKDGLKKTIAWFDHVLEEWHVIR
jgi:UDP-glucuronate decarboxylase